MIEVTDSRRARATKLVERFSLWSGAAGLIPLPFVDLAAVGGVQISDASPHFAALPGCRFQKTAAKRL